MTKRLVDLYVLGTEVSFDDPDGGAPIVVYVKKLQPFEQEVVMNRATVQRAKVLTLRKLSDDDDAILPFGLQIDENFSKDEIVQFLASDEIGQAYRSAEAKIGDEERWSKDDYLTGLQDSWDGLKDHLESEDYPEQHEDAKRVFEELKLFSNEVDAEFVANRDRIVREFNNKPEEVLRRDAILKLIEMKADMRWLDEYRKSIVWQATRINEDRHNKYFLSRDEVDEINPTIFQRLIDAYDNISVKPDEGKD